MSGQGRMDASVVSAEDVELDPLAKGITSQP